MNNSQYRFTLDLQKHQSQMSIAVYQYDNAVTLYISLTDGGKRYEIAEGSYVIFYGMRDDGKPLIHKCEVKDSTEIIYNFRNSTAYCCGIVDAQIRLYSADKRLISAPKFNISVEERVVDDDDIMLDEELFDSLDKIFTEEKARAEAEDERNEAEIARNIAEDSRVLAETERVNAETARANAEAARTEAEIQRNQTVAKKLASIKDGDSVFVRYSAYANGTNFTETWSPSLNYIGIATGQTCPTNKSDFVWVLFKGEKGDKGDTGEGFSISKTYTSVAEMHAGYAIDGVPLNAFVLIDTGNVEDEDNAKLYVKLERGYSYLTDLSGAQGIKGEKGDTPYIENGTWHIDGVDTGVNAQGILLDTPVRITTLEEYEKEPIHAPNTLYMFTDDPILEEITPTVSLTKEEGKTTLSITDVNGTKTAEILDGEPGKDAVNHTLYRNVLTLRPLGDVTFLFEFFSTTGYNKSSSSWKSLTTILADVGLGDFDQLCFIGGTRGDDFILGVHLTDSKAELSYTYGHNSTLSSTSVSCSSLAYSVKSYRIF